MHTLWMTEMVLMVHAMKTSPLIDSGMNLYSSILTYE